MKTTSTPVLVVLIARLSALGMSGVHLAGSAVPAPRERGTLRLHYVQKPIGYERYDITRDGDGLSLSSDFDFTDRGGRVQLTATLKTTPDYTPIVFTARGKSYRFVNVDSEVRIEGREAVVRPDASSGERRVPLPAQFFTVDGYAPFAAQLMLVRYWQQHGRPRTLTTVPGLPTIDVIVEERGRDQVHAGDRTVGLTQYVIDGVVWGRETLWLDQDDMLAAAITRAGGLSFEAVREDLEPALRDFVRIATRDRVADLAKISTGVPPSRSGTFALVGATIVDMTDRPPIPDGIVLVRDGRIAEVGPGSAVQIPDSVPRVDVAGKTIVPGLWDMHTHFTQVEWGPV